MSKLDSLVGARIASAKATPICYLAALAAVFATVLLRYALGTILGGNAPLLFFTLSVMVAAWYGGLWPGLLATALSTVLGTVLFIAGPRYLFVPADSSDQLHMLSFIVIGVGISLLCERMHDSQRLARQNAQSLLLLANELENRVQDRTQQLETANKELEAFSYSVSHDLRAPLRSIDGFSQILFEEYAEQLNPEAMGYLQRIRNAAQRMAQLIADLLNLSRLSRAELRLETVNLSALAQGVLNDLAARDPGRSVTAEVQPDVRARGDSRLLLVVLDNLLSNAWKYSSKTAGARIQFGVAHENGKTAYFVRDNGAGFDMDYAGKLFTPFQRLHTATEFEGSGIGLATAARIVNRHSGIIRAEGLVGKGATFVFTLG